MAGVPALRVGPCRRQVPQAGLARRRVGRCAACRRRAFDAKSGKLLWQTRLNSGVQGVPTFFEVDGAQYIAVQAGWGVDAERQANGLNGMFAERLGNQTAAAQDGAVWVFALRDRLPTP